jgi:hypothetical protein
MVFAFALVALFLGLTGVAVARHLWLLVPVYLFFAVAGVLVSRGWSRRGQRSS